MIREIALFSIITAILCAAIITVDLLFHKQRMAIMNLVWPITALYAGPLGLLTYYLLGRKSKGMATKEGGHDMHETKPFWQKTIISTLHCGSGCTLGDMVAETFTILFPVSFLGSYRYGSWLIDFTAAFAIGIIFQYYAIKPMKKLQPGEALAEALKADGLSLTAWQIGMYGGVAIISLMILRQRPSATSVAFWFVMQLAMLIGFITSYPVNWWLIKRHIKEVM
jgi:hypothetical protein